MMKEKSSRLKNMLKTPHVAGAVQGKVSGKAEILHQRIDGKSKSRENLLNLLLKCHDLHDII